MFFYVGCYNTPDSPAIAYGQITFDDQQASFKLLTPTAAQPSTQPAINNASFLWLDAPNKRLFAVSELEQYQDQATGLVASFDIRTPSQPRFISQQLSQGVAPCHLLKWQQRLISCNYGGGNIINVSIAEDGALQTQGCQLIQHTGHSINPERQTAPHTHSMTLHPQQQLAYCADLGADTITAYLLDEQGQLQPVHVTNATPGSGPRHIAIAPNGQTLYAANELNNTLDVYKVEAQGQLQLLQSISATSALTEQVAVSYPAEVCLSQDGQYLYCSNRGQDSISCFAVAEDGKLTLLATTPSDGKFPRHFSLSPCQQYVLVANQLSNNLVLFGRDAGNGQLSEPLASVSLTGPVCIAFYDPE